MNTRRLSLTVALLGLSTLIGASPANACKYCWAAEAAAGDLSQQALLQQDQANSTAGAFPLDTTISQFKPAAVPAALATPPPAGSIATSAADLRPIITKAASVKVPAVTATSQVVAASAPKSGHYADAGLLGLAAVGGVFCWRTLRVHPANWVLSRWPSSIPVDATPSSTSRPGRVNLTLPAVRIRR